MSSSFGLCEAHSTDRERVRISSQPTRVPAKGGRLAGGKDNDHEAATTHGREPVLHIPDINTHRVCYNPGPNSRNKETETPSSPCSQPAQPIVIQKKTKGRPGVGGGSSPCSGRGRKSKSQLRGFPLLISLFPFHRPETSMVLHARRYEPVYPAFVTTRYWALLPLSTTVIWVFPFSFSTRARFFILILSAYTRLQPAHLAGPRRLGVPAPPMAPHDCRFQHHCRSSCPCVPILAHIPHRVDLALSLRSRPAPCRTASL